MKRKPSNTLPFILLLCWCCLACGKKEHLTVSKTEMAFSSSGGIDVVQVDADCEWTVDYDGSHEWFTINRNNGSNKGLIIVRAKESESYNERSSSFTVTSIKGEVTVSITVKQQPIDFPTIHNKLWFLHAYERWNTDYQDEEIIESYEHWNYYIDPLFDNWFFYFLEDSTGFQVHIKDGDTTTYAYNYIYYPIGDSLYIQFETEADTVEDYHATIHQLNAERFIFSDEYRRHHFEKLFMANVYDNRTNIHFDGKKYMKKEKGPLIQVE